MGEELDDVAELTSLPAMQGFLERMKSQAGRVVAREIKVFVDDPDGGGDYGALDNLGRTKLQQLCYDFQAACAKASREDEVNTLHWRVLARATQQPTLLTGVTETPPACPDASASEQRPRPCTAPRAHHPTSRILVESRYWSIARPTDFCYGDCVCGCEKQSLPLSVLNWQQYVLRREEQEYDMPDDEVKYEAAGVNRFRSSWHDIHLLQCF